MEEVEFRKFYDRYVDLVYRLAYTYFKGNKMSAEDIVQEVFMKVFMKQTKFESREHEKAWLIRVTSNLCKNKVSHWWNKIVNIDKLGDIETFDSDNTILSCVLSLPMKQRVAIYLHYYEGYAAKEIAKLLNKNENTIFGYLHQGREMLKSELGDDFNE